MNLFGNEPMPPQQVTQFRRSGEEPQNSSMMAMMAALEEEKRKRQMQGVLSLVGLAALSGKMDGGGKTPAGKGGAGKAGAPAGNRGLESPLSPGNRGLESPLSPGVTGKAKAGGRSRRASGAAASKPAAQSSKIFPIGMMGAGTAAASGGLMNSPMAVAGLAGGLELVGGLMGGGGDQEQLAKDQLRSSRQMNLFDGVRAMTDGIRQRSQEMRAALAGLGR